jgi:prepilin-type processing-associated H-X9-DG protein
MPMYMKWDGIDAREGSTAHTVTLTQVDWTGALVDENAKPSAFAAYSADANTGGANVAMGDGSVRFLSDPIVVHDAQPQPVLLVIADLY